MPDYGKPLGDAVYLLERKDKIYCINMKDFYTVIEVNNNQITVQPSFDKTPWTQNIDGFSTCRWGPQ